METVIQVDALIEIQLGAIIAGTYFPDMRAGARHKNHVLYFLTGNGIFSPVTRTPQGGQINFLSGFVIRVAISRSGK